jgi:hypothetical protein
MEPKYLSFELVENIQIQICKFEYFYIVQIPEIQFIWFFL